MKKPANGPSDPNEVPIEKPPRPVPDLITAICRPIDDDFLDNPPTLTVDEGRKKVGENIIKHYAGIAASIINQTLPILEQTIGSLYPPPNDGGGNGASDSDSGSSLFVQSSSTFSAKAPDAPTSIDEAVAHAIQERREDLATTPADAQILRSLRQPPSTHAYTPDTNNEAVKALSRALALLQASEKRRNELLRHLELIDEKGELHPLLRPQAQDVVMDGTTTPGTVTTPGPSRGADPWAGSAPATPGDGMGVKRWLADTGSADMVMSDSDRPMTGSSRRESRDGGDVGRNDVVDQESAGAQRDELALRVREMMSMQPDTPGGLQAIFAAANSESRERERGRGERLDGRQRQGYDPSRDPRLARR